MLMYDVCDKVRVGRLDSVTASARATIAATEAAMAERVVGIAVVAVAPLGTGDPPTAAAAGDSAAALLLAPSLSAAAAADAVAAAGAGGAA